MRFDDITPEQLERAKACKSAKELSDLASDEGIELTDEQLDAVSGGWGPGPCEGFSCPSDTTQPFPD